MSNKRVLKVNAGGSTGSIFSLDIGDELIKEERGGQTFYQGECLLMIYCSWRLFDIHGKKPVTGCHENSDLNGSMTLGLKSLLDDTVEKVLLTSFYDISVVFKSGKILSVFCDLTPYVDEETNWFFGLQGKYYSINNNLQLVED
ncbi:hypothetical protein [Fulvivirga imtechensis]|nr:hypothetical protein [Fulvivirga imtechensis]